MEHISRKLARFAVNLKYEDLDDRSVHEAKRYLLDSLGCALGGSRTHDAKIIFGFIEEEGGREEATLIGTRRKVPASWASFYNALIVRALDYNDIYWKADPSHPSDILPAALAVAEREGLGGREVLLGIVIGHELEMRFCEAAEPGIRERGWHHASLTGFVSPVVAGRLLGLSEEQIQNAIGISGCHTLTLGAVTAGKLTMMKNTVDPIATWQGTLAALWAQKGYIGPEHVIDGKEGLFHCLGEKWLPGKLTDGLGESFKIKDCSMKFFPTEALTHSPLTAALKLREDHGIDPEAIEEITIHTVARAVDILCDPSKYSPASKETADHSLPYCVAVAFMDGIVTPESFEEKRFADRKLLALVGKVKGVADPEIEKTFPALYRCDMEVRMKDGTVHSTRVDYPKGDPRNPLTDKDVEGKFLALAEPVLPEGKAREVISIVDGLDKEASLDRLFAALVAR
ncbi:MAG TPA: MmgE/PrpD family protein [Candidatus Saccharimonadales bacterium]|nr:MmgE/PrpD family protein [Candidatus Saccharimonadales bacterium]